MTIKDFTFTSSIKKNPHFHLPFLLKVVTSTVRMQRLHTDLYKNMLLSDVFKIFTSSYGLSDFMS